MTFTRITVRPDVCTGKPCIRDLRFPVSRLLGLLASGQSREDVLRAYPFLEPADIDEAFAVRRKSGGRRDHRAYRLKFLVDMPVTPLTVTHLRAIGHGAVHAHEIGLAQLLDAARREERITVTADLDYPRLLALHQASRPASSCSAGARTRMPTCWGCSIECRRTRRPGPRGIDRRR
jgi:uncharacterized protein (DUF433 family)